MLKKCNMTKQKQTKKTGTGSGSPGNDLVRAGKPLKKRKSREWRQISIFEEDVLESLRIASDEMWIENNRPTWIQH